MIEQAIPFLITVLSFLVVITIVVFVHEYGHFWVARRNGVRVHVFSVGFGKELLGYTDKHGTRWRFSAIPLGGYVKMHGDADASSSTPDAEASLDPDSFPAKNVYQRMAIVFAGPGINFLFSIIVFALIFSFVGRSFAPAVVELMSEDGAAAESGIMLGDRIVSIEGNDIESFADVQAIVYINPEVPLQFQVERDGAIEEIVVTPRLSEFDDNFGNTHRVGLIGVQTNSVEYVDVSFTGALIGGVEEVWRIISQTLQSLYEMIIGARGTEELGGPLRIAQMSGVVAEMGVVPALQFIAMISVALGLINLFPIPMLDGGHLAMFTIEALRGKPLSEQSQEWAFRVGLTMVLCLMVFATWNDIVHLELFSFLS